MTQPDILERFQANPDSIDANDRFTLGLSLIRTVTSGKADAFSLNGDLLAVGMGQAAQALGQIRTGQEYSEAQRLTVAIHAMRDTQSIKLDDLTTPDAQRAYLDFFREFMLTLVAGTRTHLNAAIRKSNERIISGFTIAAGVLMLHGRRDLSPVEQVGYINEDLQTNMTADLRRTTAIGWAKHLVAPDMGTETGKRAEPVEDEQFIAILGYFGELKDQGAIGEVALSVDDSRFGEAIKHFGRQGDMETLRGLTIAKLTSVMQGDAVS